MFPLLSHQDLIVNDPAYILDSVHELCSGNQPATDLNWPVKKLNTTGRTEHLVSGWIRDG